MRRTLTHRYGLSGPRRRPITWSGFERAPTIGPSASCTGSPMTRWLRSTGLPSVYRDREGGETPVPELLGQTLLEGMACGTPAVCTRVASLPEVVDDGVTGIIVPPNDPVALGAAIRWLRHHPS